MVATLLTSKCLNPNLFVERTIGCFVSNVKDYCQYMSLGARKDGFCRRSPIFCDPGRYCLPFPDRSIPIVFYRRLKHNQMSPASHAGHAWRARRLRGRRDESPGRTTRRHEMGTKNSPSGTSLADHTSGAKSFFLGGRDRAARSLKRGRGTEGSASTEPSPDSYEFLFFIGGK